MAQGTSSAQPNPAEICLRVFAIGFPIAFVPVLVLVQHKLNTMLLEIDVVLPFRVLFLLWRPLPWLIGVLWAGAIAVEIFAPKLRVVSAAVLLILSFALALALNICFVPLSSCLS